MSAGSKRDALLNDDAAFAKARSIDDLGRKQFILQCLMTVVRRVIRGEIPDSPVDMTFLLECASDLYDERQVLARIFDGEDLRWWPDE